MNSPKKIEKSQSTRLFALTLATSFLLTACSSTQEITEMNAVQASETNNEAWPASETATNLSFSSPIVTTGQTDLYDKDGNLISSEEGDPFFGQDGNFTSLEFSFTLNKDGTTSDNNTSLMWETIPMGGKMSWEEAIAYCNELELGGYDDWRIPTVEELFSISDFSQGWPYLDTEFFAFDDSGDSAMMAGGSAQGGSPQGGSSQSGAPQGMSATTSGNQLISLNAPPEAQGNQGVPPEMGEMPAGEMPVMGEMQAGEMPVMGEMPAGEMPVMGEMPAGEMPVMGEMPAGEMPVMGEMPEGDQGGASKDDGQFWTASENLVEGDDRLGNIAFGVNHTTGHIKAYPADSTPMMGKYVRAVRGEVYGAEDYTDNGDGTVTDNASGLMWQQVDLRVAVDWEEALFLAETAEFAGYSDWRLPDVKELQSIVDYGGAYPAINQDFFTITALEENENDYFWTSTSAFFSESSPEYDSAWYVAFGYTSHGAGAVRFSPKYEESEALSEGEDNILNSVRLVRNITE